MSYPRGIFRLTDVLVIFIAGHRSWNYTDSQNISPPIACFGEDRKYYQYHSIERKSNAQPQFTYLLIIEFTNNHNVKYANKLHISTLLIKSKQRRRKLCVIESTHFLWTSMSSLFKFSTQMNWFPTSKPAVRCVIFVVNQDHENQVINNAISFNLY